MDWKFLTLLAIVAVQPIALFFARNWIKARIEKGIQYSFDKNLESVRTEFRKSEELLKADLAAKEAEISALRDSALGGRANRQSLLDKRRLESIERTWAAVVELSPFLTISALMSGINIQYAAKRAPTDQKLRGFFTIILSAITTDKLPNQRLKNEQLFVSPLAWAYFSAYQAILYGTYGLAKALEGGLDKVDDLFNFGLLNNMLKTTLPHRSEFIDKNGHKAYHHLLDELEKSLFAELQKMLAGADVDEASLAQSTKILDAVKEFTEKQRQTSAPIDTGPSESEATDVDARVKPGHDDQRV